MTSSSPTKEIENLNAQSKSNWGGARPGAGRPKGSVNVEVRERRIALERAIKKHKLTAERAVERISDGLDAERTVIIGSGDNAFADQVPDHATRLKASNMALELLGLKNNDSGNTFNFNFIASNRGDYAD